MKKKIVSVIILLSYFGIISVYFLWVTGWFENPNIRSGKSWTGLLEEKVIAMRPTKTRVQSPNSLKPSPTPIPVSKPVQLVIEKIGIDAEVIEVGLVQGTNTMDVPKDGFKAGWYNQGPMPGEEGSSVITAHYDTPTGAPALFYKLKTIEKGDEFFIVDEKGKKIEYVVQQAKNIPVSTFPKDLIYKDKGFSQISLITCSGIWNPLSRDYSSRYVVIATLKNISNFKELVAVGKQGEIEIMQPIEQKISSGKGKPGISTQVEENAINRFYIETADKPIKAVDLYIKNASQLSFDTITVTNLFQSYVISRPREDLVLIHLFQPQDFAAIDTSRLRMSMVEIQAGLTSELYEISWEYPFASKMYPEDTIESQLPE